MIIKSRLKVQEDQEERKGEERKEKERKKDSEICRSKKQKNEEQKCNSSKWGQKMREAAKKYPSSFSKLLFSKKKK